MTGTGESLNNTHTHTHIREYIHTHTDRRTHIQRQAAGPFVVHRDLLYYPAVTCPVGCMWPPAPTQQRVKWAEQPRLQGCRETRETQPFLPHPPPPPPSLYLLSVIPITSQWQYYSVSTHIQIHSVHLTHQLPLTKHISFSVSQTYTLSCSLSDTHTQNTVFTNPHYIFFTHFFSALGEQCPRLIRVEREHMRGYYITNPLQCMCVCVFSEDV